VARDGCVMAVRRSVVATLVCMGLGGLSCEISPSGFEDPRPLAARTLPPVSAAPPAITAEAPALAAASIVAGAEAATAEAAELIPDDEQYILQDLRSRHTTLSDRELVALARAIVEEATLYDLDPMLVMAVIQIESAGYHMAVSPVGAMGLMQLLPSTGEELARKLGVDWRGPDTLFDPFVNVKLGTAYLRQLADRYQNVNIALAAYNWGPGRIDRRIRRGASMPVRYTDAVMKALDKRDSRQARSS
jgi:soluble lytic murein transglycosylase-like protein